MKVPNQFWLHRLKILANESGMFDLAIDIGSELEIEGQVTFVNSSEIRLNLGGTAPLSVFGFYVDDIRDRGWEGAQYQVRQAEQGAISLVCEKVKTEEPD